MLRFCKKCNFVWTQLSSYIVYFLSAGNRQFLAHGAVWRHESKQWAKNCLIPVAVCVTGIRQYKAECCDNMCGPSKFFRPITVYFQLTTNHLEIDSILPKVVKNSDFIRECNRKSTVYIWHFGLKFLKHKIILIHIL